MHHLRYIATRKIFLYGGFLFLIFLLVLFFIYWTTEKSPAPEDTSALTTSDFSISKINYVGRVAVSDIDGDGKKDIVINEWGSNRSAQNNGTLKWFKNPNWQEYTIKTGNFWGDSVEIVTLRGDEKVYIVASKGSSKSDRTTFYSYSLKSGGTPTVTADWVEQELFNYNEKGEVKDMEIKDIDKDGKLDIMIRHSLKLKIYYQQVDGSWDPKDKPTTSEGSAPEGLGVMDVDGDGYLDAVMEGFWLLNPKTRDGNWQRYDFDNTWHTNQKSDYRGYSVKVAIGDFDGNGKDDFAISQSEDTNFPIRWYQLKPNTDPKSGTSAWNIKTVEASANYNAHTLQAADFNGDGLVDLLSAGLPRTHKEHYLYINKGGGNSFEKIKIIGAGSAYSAKVADLNGDNKPDIISSAIWDKNEVEDMLGEGEVVTKVMINNMVSSVAPPTKREIDSWERVAIGNSDRRIHAVSALDVDGDGLLDIISGKSWWKQPANIKGSWTSNAIVNGFDNFFYAGQFNNDNKLDLLGSTGNAMNSKVMVWGKSVNKSFSLVSNIAQAPQGDFPQGVVEVKIGNDRYVAISWHEPADHPMQFFKINGESGTWAVTELEGIKSENEDLSVGDIDGDGDEDIFQGTKWLRNNGSVDNWTQHSVDTTFVTSFPGSAPDRNVLKDFNGDGLLDAVVSLEAGKPVIFYKNPGGLKDNPNKAWPRTIIYNIDGEGFSMDAGDIDQDGDIDIVLGEHKGVTENRVIILENLDKSKADREDNWKEHVIDKGPKGTIDHHIGTQLFDIDKDGDLDILSIGWFNQKVWLYINTSTPANNPTVTPSNTIVPATNIPDKPSPTNTVVPVNTATPSVTSPQGNICGKADTDGNGVFTINDFSEFARVYGRGKNTCADKDVDYGPCGGKDVNRDGILNIIDFTGFAWRYYPKTSCIL